MMQRYEVLGLMSGTSLDGLDMAYCHFEKKKGGWTFKISKAETKPYAAPLKRMLSEAHKSTSEALHLLDIELGRWMGQQAKDFLNDCAPPHLIASHGHTIFHQPEKGLSLQIGNPHFISKITHCPVVADFRQGDVALQGQGAPLVPLGDKMLFSSYAACLNLGGFSNISADRDGERIAFDISPCNIPLNELAAHLGMAYDSQGAEASRGSIIPDLLEQLNALPWYQKSPPKSLGREWYEQTFRPLFIPHLKREKEVRDLLRTFNEHIAYQITETLKNLIPTEGSCLVSGGGAFNSFLMDRIKVQLPTSISVIEPPREVIEFKEALIFAFLGLLRYVEAPNILASVTGAERDSCSGVIYLP